MEFLVVGALAFACGDWLGIILPQIDLKLLGILIGILFTVLIFSFFIKKEKIIIVTYILGLLLLSCLGLSAGSYANISFVQGLASYCQQDVCLTGQIVPGSLKKSEEKRFNVLVDIEGFQFDNKWSPITGKVLLTVDTKNIKGEFAPQYEKIRFRGQLLPMVGFANPGGYDGEIATKVKNISGRMKCRAEEINVYQTAVPFTFYFAELANNMRNKLKMVMPTQEAAVLAGMVLGGYDGIDQDLVREFSLTGIVHILSVSGSHVALLVGFVLCIFSGKRIKGKFVLMLAGVLIILYSLLCGFSPPVLRSLLMGLAMLVGMGLERKEDRGAVLALVLMAMLAYRPFWILDIGFQLSFLATAGLVYLFTPLKKILPDKWPVFIRDGLSVTLAAQIATLPLLVYYFHQISFCSLLANLIVVPVLEFVVLLTVTGLAISFCLWPLAKIVLVLGSMILSLALRLNSAVGQMPLANIVLGQLNIYLTVIYYIGIAGWLGLFPFNNFKVWERRSIVALCIFSLSFHWLVTLLQPQAFTVYFLDVGQGDAALVVTKTRKSILIDTGGLYGNYNTGERIVAPTLKYLGISKLDVLILSHGHHDHAGGAAGLAKNIPITEVLLPNEPQSDEITELLHTLPANAQTKVLSTGKKFLLDDCLIETIYAPHSDIANSNESSSIVRISEADSSVLFTGDATEEEELAACGSNVASVVLKVAHHGSAYSSTPAFLSAVGAKLAVISVGYNNFGHPAPETLAKLDAASLQKLRTDLLGCIKVVFDGSNCTWYSYRYQKEKF